MAEVARRAGVGMATLYRNFQGRRELLEALFAGAVDDLCEAAGQVSGPPGEVLLAWLRRLALFHHSKHPIAAELLRHTDATDPVFGSSRDRVLAAGRPQLLAAHQAHQVRADLGLDQVLDLVLAAATIRGEPAYVEGHPHLRRPHRRRKYPADHRVRRRTRRRGRRTSRPRDRPWHPEAHRGTSLTLGYPWAGPITKGRCRRPRRTGPWDHRQAASPTGSGWPRPAARCRYRGSR